MNEFKVGDRVKVLESDYSTAQNYIGQIGTIDKKDCGNRVHFANGESWWYINKDLELVEESKQMKKYDMDKWLKSVCTKEGYISNTATSINYYYMGGENSIYKEDFDTYIIDFIDYCNKKGANLSYPEEIKEPEFNFVEYIGNDIARIQIRAMCDYNNEDFYFNSEAYKSNKHNADILIEMAKLAKGLER